MCLGRKRCLGAKCSREEMVLRSKGFQGAKCVEKQSVPGSKRCYGAESSEGQRGLESKVFRAAKHSMRQSVLRSKLH